MAVPLKPALTLEEQLEHVQNEHGLFIGDVARAREILSQVNYYRLGAYGIGLRRADDPEKYKEGISLEHLYRLYTFDSHLRSALLHLIEQVEIEMRTQITYQLSLRYGPEGYRDVRNFCDQANAKGQSVHAALMDRFDREVSRQSSLPCVQHHQQKYGGHFPLWAAMELFSFGMTSTLYTLMRPEDQCAVASFYGVSERHLGGWLQTLVELRNRCAHYGRVYNMPLARIPYLYKEYKPYRSNKLFPAMLVLRRMMGRRASWNVFYNTLEALIDEYAEVRLSFMGFPENWKDLLGRNPEARLPGEGR